LSRVLRGIPAAPGIAIGPARIRDTGSGGVRQPCDDRPGTEQLESAIRRARAQLQSLVERITAAAGPEEAAIFRAHLLMLDDPLLLNSVQAGIRGGHDAGSAVESAIESLAREFDRLTDPRLKERAADLRDVGRRILANLRGEQSVDLPESGVLFSRSISPSEIGLLNCDANPGVVAETGTASCHAAILARALGIAAIMGVEGALSAATPGETVIADGSQGEVILGPDESVVEEYRRRAARASENYQRLAALRDAPAVTLDGFRVELAANMSGSDGVEAAFAAGAESIGLLRTELLFVDRDAMPSEDEQFEVYRDILSRAAPRRVTIRILDLGGDKELPYCPLPREQNPALGLRGIRFCLEREPVFRAQLRALARAARGGNLAILLPMVSDMSEIRRTRALLAEVCGGSCPIPLGTMVETPAAALMAAEFSTETDFLSIGTNDLVQHTLAVDRLDERLASLYNPFHPAILRLLSMVSRAAPAGKRVAVCGEMAADPRAAPIFAGMGFAELSMEPASIPEVKSAIRSFRQAEAAALIPRLLASTTALEVAGRLADWFECR
jgi:phosphoenolpyruvate-protein phosphotransferase (PTS system enzyme I)